LYRKQTSRDLLLDFVHANIALTEITIKGYAEVVDKG